MAGIDLWKGFAQRQAQAAPGRGGEDGVFLLDLQARILFANGAAQALLAQRRDLRREGHALACARRADTAALRRLLATADQPGEGGSLVLAGEEGPSLLLIVLPFRTPLAPVVLGTPCAILFARALDGIAELSLRAFAAHWQLTPAETAVLGEILRGEGVAAAAARRGIGYATARSHLLHIFEKTGMRRQAELVSLVLRWTGAPIASDARASA